MYIFLFFKKTVMYPSSRKPENSYWAQIIVFDAALEHINKNAFREGQRKLLIRTRGQRTTNMVSTPYLCSKHVYLGEKVKKLVEQHITFCQELTTFYSEALSI
jgi:hypothetical protein